MAIIKTPENYPKRIGEYVIYTSRGQTIFRSISGFTTEALKNNAKYKKCRQNASEFGKLSALCKTIRVALQPILPKANNLALVNSFTKKMHEVMTCDTSSVKGMRTLKAGLTTTKGKLLLQNYHFNPQITYTLPVTITDKLIVDTSTMIFPKQGQYLEACVYYLNCNWETQSHTFITSEKVVYKKNEVPGKMTLSLLKDIPNNGTFFTILGLTFYKKIKENFEPMKDDSSKVVMVLRVE
jgi:hypothetical protein